jgi:hypothetical protein
MAGRVDAKMMSNIDYSTFPGGVLIKQGLDDLAGGVESVAARLVLIGGPRLRRMGLPIAQVSREPELLLYKLLAEDNPDSAHSRYNALIRLLVSFERAVECVVLSKKSG